MSLSFRNRIKTIEEKHKPPEQWRIKILLMDGAFDDPTNEVDCLYMENKPARDARFMKRFQKGLINHDTLLALCNEPLPAGAIKIEECDFPLEAI
jgi:hypothetical protein